MKNIPIGCRF